MLTKIKQTQKSGAEQGDVQDISRVASWRANSPYGGEKGEALERESLGKSRGVCCGRAHSVENSVRSGEVLEKN